MSGARRRTGHRVLLAVGWLAVLAALGPLLMPTGEPATGALDAPAPVPTAPPSAPTTAPPSSATPTPPVPRPTGTLPGPDGSAPTTTAAAVALPVARTGTAMGYTMEHGSSCSYPDVAASGAYVSVGPAMWAGSTACGTVLEVTGPAGAVRVTVADECPECHPGQLDLAAPAFAKIGGKPGGWVPITFSRVVDPPVGPVRVYVHAEAHPYWLSLLPMDTGNPVTAVAVRTGSSWQSMRQEEWGDWTLEDGAATAPPFQVRLTDDRGHTVTVTVPLAPGRIVDTGKRLY